MGFCRDRERQRNYKEMGLGEYWTFWNEKGSGDIWVVQNEQKGGGGNQWCSPLFSIPLPPPPPVFLQGNTESYARLACNQTISIAQYSPTLNKKDKKDYFSYDGYIKFETCLGMRIRQVIISEDIII